MTRETAKKIYLNSFKKARKLASKIENEQEENDFDTWEVECINGLLDEMYSEYYKKENNVKYNTSVAWLKYNTCVVNDYIAELLTLESN